MAYKRSSLSRNIFSSKTKDDTRASFSLQNDFPALSGPSLSGPTLSGPVNGLNYTRAIQKDVVTENVNHSEKKETVLEPGTVCYSLEKDHSISVRYGPGTGPGPGIGTPILDTESTEDKMNRVIDSIMSNWERFKTDFIERNGEDLYHRWYSLPSSFSDDDDEDEEYESDFV